jgi:hypothetical protein
MVRHAKLETIAIATVPAPHILNGILREISGLLLP